MRLRVADMKRFETRPTKKKELDVYVKRYPDRFLHSNEFDFQFFWLSLFFHPNRTYFLFLFVMNVN